MATTKEILKFAVEMGDLMLRNGAEIYRVEDTVSFILKSHDVHKYDVYVLSNGIFASANEDMEDACSVIRDIPLGGVHLGRLAALNQLTRDVCGHEITIEDAWGKIEQYKNIPEYSLPVQTFMCGLGSAGFAYMFGGSLVDIGLAFAIGFLEQLIISYCEKKNISKFVKVLAASVFVAYITAACLSAGMPIHRQTVIIGSTMVIFPGIAFTTGIRDIYNGDYLSGVIHIFDSLLTAVCIAVGSCLPQILHNAVGLL